MIQNDGSACKVRARRETCVSVLRALGGETGQQSGFDSTLISISHRLPSYPICCWHCPHSTQSTVYVTVRCPFVCLSVCPIRPPHSSAAGPASRRHRSIAARRSAAGAPQQQMWAVPRCQLTQEAEQRRYQQTIGRSRAEGTPTRHGGNTNRLTPSYPSQLVRSCRRSAWSTFPAPLLGPIVCWCRP